jgi:hypothetical protein
VKIAAANLRATPEGDDCLIEVVSDCLIEVLIRLGAADDLEGWGC